MNAPPKKGLREMRAAAEADGWKPGEVCTCREPDYQEFGGGDRYYIGGVCRKCKRKVRA